MLILICIGLLLLLPRYLATATSSNLSSKLTFSPANEDRWGAIPGSLGYKMERKLKLNVLNEDKPLDIAFDV